VLTILDTLGRCWTITTERTVVGFRWAMTLKFERGPVVRPCSWPRRARR
jgi:hypothetical protein